MDRTWMPVTGGIINIISGAISVIGALVLIIIGALGTAFMGMFGQEVPAWVPIAIFSGIGVVCLVLGVLAIVGGYYALKRRVWGMALAGAIMSIFIIWPLGIASTVFIVLSSKEFN